MDASVLGLARCVVQWRILEIPQGGPGRGWRTVRYEPELFVLSLPEMTLS
ncbi:MAG: hypothetical protein M1557_00045 [Actinobacteria bacterium]|nr:hypothetical protein [Actinomycetota bacterium]